MENGDAIRVRRHFDSLAPRHWVSAQVDLISENGESVAVSAEEGLSTEQGFGLNQETGRQLLLLMKGSRFYQDIVTQTWWEIEESQELK